MIVFNKRRGGEASRMTLQDYIQRPTWDIQKEDDIYNSLSNTEKAHVKILDLIKIKGKRGRSTCPCNYNAWCFKSIICFV